MSFESESQDEFNEITLVLFGEKKSSPSFFFGFRNFLKLHIESPAFSLVFRSFWNHTLKPQLFLWFFSDFEFFILNRSYYMSFESESQDEFNEVTLVPFGEKKSSFSFFFGFSKLFEIKFWNSSFFFGSSVAACVPHSSNTFEISYWISSFFFGSFDTFEITYWSLSFFFGRSCRP